MWGSPTTPWPLLAEALWEWVCAAVNHSMKRPIKNQLRFSCESWLSYFFYKLRCYWKIYCLIFKTLIWTTEWLNSHFIYFEFLFFEISKNDKRRETCDAICALDTANIPKFDSIVTKWLQKPLWQFSLDKKKLFFTYT